MGRSPRRLLSASTTGRYGVATYVASAASDPQQVLDDLARVAPLG